MTQDKQIRVRFAPSPTGSLHIGGARTAYFNWLFARQNKGSFVLRIDDTDTSRSTEASYQQILDSFRWLGIDWDEGPGIGGEFGPYRQSERQPIYERAMQRLMAEGRVYPCFCTPEQLAADREAAQQAGVAPRYVGRCKHLSDAERAERLEAGAKPAYRLVAPEAGETIVHDIIRGDVIFSNQEIDDFIVWKGDGTPTYHFASCVDDAQMQISHVIRAEEHLSNTPRHVVLFQALGVESPEFAHVPMILAPDRSKLSKRHGATSVQEYRDDGILPEALVNYLLLLGFAPGEDREIVSREEAISLFHLTRVAKHAAVYDVKKLQWLNAHYLRSMTPDRLLDLVWPDIRDHGWLEPNPSHVSLGWLRSIIQVLQERIRSIADLKESLKYYFEEVEHYDEKGVHKHFLDEGAADRLERAAVALEKVEPFTLVEVENLYRDLISELQVKGGQLIHPTRLAISGITVGPGLFDMMALLGRETCLRRMRLAAEKIRFGEWT
jgi:glutamyl-tRNA synthetase